MEKQLLDYKFKFLTEIVPDKNENGKVIEINYTDQAQKNGDELNKYGGMSFCTFSLNIEENKQGLYALYIDDILQYVGETSNLKSRWGKAGYSSISYGNSLKGGQITNCMVNAYICDGAKRGKKIKLYFCEHDSAERQIILKCKPKLNVLFNKSLE